jgi:sugar phosphate isomerase/epimerase
MKLAVANHPRRELLQQIRWIAEHGFSHIDLTLEAPAAAIESHDWVVIASAMRDAGLGVICRAPSYLPLHNPSPLVRQAVLDELRRSIDVAQVVGASLCTSLFVGWPAHLAEEQGYEFYRQAYAILIRHGAERGVQVALENSANNKHQLKYFREIFFRLPGLKLAFDIGHGNINTARSMTRDYGFALADRLVHVHLSDNDGSADDRLPFGAPSTGGIALHHELQGLKDFRYDGIITLEIEGDPRWLLAAAERVREAASRRCRSVRCD